MFNRSRVALGELDVGGLLAAAATVILRLDEAEAARMIEEFHSAVDTSHWEFPFPLKVKHKRAIGPRKGRPSAS